MIEIEEIAKKLRGYIGKKWSTKRKNRMYRLLVDIGVEENDFNHIQCHLSKTKTIWSISVGGNTLQVIRGYGKTK